MIAIYVFSIAVDGRYIAGRAVIVNDEKQYQ